MTSAHATAYRLRQRALGLCVSGDKNKTQCWYCLKCQMQRRRVIDQRYNAKRKTLREEELSVRLGTSRTASKGKGL